MVPLAASPHPLGVSVLAKPRYGGKGLVMNTETCSSHTYHSEIIRVLEALCQELGTDQVCVSSCITVSQVHSVPVTCHCQCCPWPPGWHGVCQSSADEGTLSSFPSCTLAKDIMIRSPHLRNEEWCSPSWRAECLHKLFGILLYRRFVCFLHLLIQSYISYRLMVI